MFPTLEQFAGSTPLVRLQRIPGRTTNAILAKLEGSNPAGSVKDRPELSMVLGAERRREIKPGDTLIEATSGYIGIALAMAAAIRGYRIVPEAMVLTHRFRTGFPPRRPVHPDCALGVALSEESL